MGRSKVDQITSHKRVLSHCNYFSSRVKDTIDECSCCTSIAIYLYLDADFLISIDIVSELRRIK